MRWPWPRRRPPTIPTLLRPVRVDGMPAVVCLQCPAGTSGLYFGPSIAAAQAALAQHTTQAHPTTTGDQRS